MAEAINPRDARVHAHIIPFPKHRIVRYRRAPKDTPADAAFDAGWRFALDVMMRLNHRGTGQ